MVATETTWTYEDLEELLGQREWQAADQVTLSLLLNHGSQPAALAPIPLTPGKGGLNQAAIAHIPCETLHELDRCWRIASGGKFGFSIQRQLYEANDCDPFALSKQVGWLLLAASRPLGFYKFYDFLQFELDAPPGHLPAYWYWQLGWHRSWRKGGFGTGRGAAFGDAPVLDAMMLRLDRCSLV